MTSDEKAVFRITRRQYDLMLACHLLIFGAFLAGQPVFAPPEITFWIDVGLIVIVFFAVIYRLSWVKSRFQLLIGYTAMLSAIMMLIWFVTDWFYVDPNNCRYETLPQNEMRYTCDEGRVYCNNLCPSAEDFECEYECEGLGTVFEGQQGLPFVYPVETGRCREWRIMRGGVEEIIDFEYFPDE